MSEVGETPRWRGRTIEVIGARLGLGGRCLGTRGGPAAMRMSGLAAALGRSGRLVRDLGDIVARDVARVPGRDPGAELSAEVERYSLELRAAMEAVLARGALPCIVGGDHSLGAATQAAVGRFARRQGWAPPGIIWIDAHADSNTMETTPSGNLHGMMLAAVHGLEVPTFRRVVEGGLRDPRRTVFLGARDIDAGEREIVGRLGCTVIGPEEIARLGPAKAAREAIRIAGGADGRCSVSFDLDSLDPSIAPGVDCHVPGGLDWASAETILRICGEAPGLVAVEVVEVNPSADPDGRTARLAVEAAALLCP
ncbi:MAG: arginase [Planctomycetaceae bacterium]|nr:arginase [Planctomycetaceae bacterium]